jgi:hypothetical protein
MCWVVVARKSGLRKMYRLPSTELWRLMSTFGIWMKNRVASSRQLPCDHKKTWT